MRKTIFCVVLALMLASSAGFAQEVGKVWRAGVQWAHPMDSDTRDGIDDGWGLSAEYSFGNVLGGESMQTDLSAAISYKWFDDLAELKVLSLGAKWRAGTGASPDMDGFYGGVGAGIAWIDAESGGLSDDGTEFEWSVFAGMNFGMSWYAELAYSDTSSFDFVGEDVDTSMLTATVGYRF